MLIGWMCAAGAAVLGLSLLQQTEDGTDKGGGSASAVRRPRVPPTSRPSRDRPPPLRPPGDKYDFVISPGQRIAGVRPRPGQWVKISAGSYKALAFPASGQVGRPIYYCFDPGAIIDGGGENVVVAGGEYLYIQGMTVRNARNGLQAENAAVKIGTGTTLADCVIEDVSGAGLAIYGRNVTVLRTIFRRCGHEAFTTQFASNVLIKDCAILHCNDGLDDPPWKSDSNAVQIKGKWYVNPDWEAVCKIWGSDHVTLDGVESAYNVGPGLWTDFKNSNITITNCYSHDNRGLSDDKSWQGEGIRLELSPNEGPMRVTNCLFEKNSGAGITLTSVRDVEIRGNTFVGGIGVLFRNDDGRGGLSGITISGNTFDRAGFAVWGQRFAMKNISIDGDTFTAGTRPLFNWDRVDYDSLAEVRRVLKFEQHGRMD